MVTDVFGEVGRCRNELRLQESGLWCRQDVSSAGGASDAEAGERLVALRQHLLQLGATEGELQALRDRSVELTPHTPPATPDPARETSVVEILEVRNLLHSTLLFYCQSFLLFWCTSSQHFLNTSIFSNFVY